MKKQSRFSILSTLQFIMRFLGLNGLVAVAVGLVLWYAMGLEFAGMVTVIAGASAVALALLAEVRGVAGAVVSHRGAAGVNVFVQVALAAGLVIGGNYYAFHHSRRFDLTHDRAFTLSESLRDKLAKLRGDTDIIVYLQHVSFGQRVELRQDDYDQAAEKIITRKVVDLVEQFSEIGPRFRVHILDTQKKNIKTQRDKIKAISPTLLETIEKAPENSIFFYSPDTKHLQRLAFNELFYLDKKASEEANDRRGNLVLIDQGIENFADKIFKIEEKAPRVTVAVTHGWLGQDGTDEYGMPGFKTMLATRGFVGRDVVLKRWPERVPVVLDQDENRYIVLENKKVRLEDSIEALEDEIKDYHRAKALLDASKIAEFNKEFIFVLFPAEGFRAKTREWLNIMRREGRNFFVRLPIDRDQRDDAAKSCVDGVDYDNKEIATYRKKLERTIEEQSKLPEERFEEQARMSDLRAKFKRMLADTDLLVVPRLTTMNLIEGKAISPEAHSMSEAQAEAVKDFIKAGKPVLFCMGPLNSPARAGKEPVEKMLAEFNINLSSQAVLFTSDTEAMEERDEKTLMGGALVEVPAVKFDWAAQPTTHALATPGAKMPIRTSMQLTTRAFSSTSRESLKIRYPRPIYVETWAPATVAGAVGTLALPWPGGAGQALAGMHFKKYDDRAVFIMSDADCWNEDRPLPPDDGRAPHFEKPKDDPNIATLQERRKGPFPIGVALEADVPPEWYDKTPELATSVIGALASPMASGPLVAAANAYPREQEPRHTVRLAVIGDGAVFKGERLSPLSEKLFLDVSNWLLGREPLLARDTGVVWSYPRLSLEAGVLDLWQWGARVGLPLLFVYLGLNVWLVRRMR